MQTIAEGDYLCAILNSPLATELAAPIQSQGAFGARHFLRYPWNQPFPEFNPARTLHQDLAHLGAEAREVAAGVDVEGMGFQKARSEIRTALSDLLSESDRLVQQLLG